MSRPPVHADKGDLGFKYRNALSLMTMCNGKTPRGEKFGYLTAILYLAPDTVVSPVTLCPHSDDACRTMCLAGSGLSGLPRATEARRRRTQLFIDDRAEFLRRLTADLAKLQVIAGAEGMRPVARLNGTSDLLWERIAPELFSRWPDLQHSEYTKVPLHLRRAPANLHLTYSVGGPDDMARAVDYLRAGWSIAVVVPEDVKHALVGASVDLGSRAANFIDGDLHDLRHLDPPASIVLLKPKGRVRTELVRPDIVRELTAAAKEIV